MKTLIYCRFLFKSRFGIEFTYFDRLLADAADEDCDSPDFCKMVAAAVLYRGTLLPEVWNDFIFDLKEALCK